MLHLLSSLRYLCHYLIDISEIYSNASCISLLPIGPHKGAPTPYILQGLTMAPCHPEFHRQQGVCKAKWMCPLAVCNTFSRLFSRYLRLTFPALMALSPVQGLCRPLFWSILLMVEYSTSMCIPRAEGWPRHRLLGLGGAVEGLGYTIYRGEIQTPLRCSNEPEVH